MIRAASIDDFVENAEMAAAPLRSAGIDVTLATIPLDWHRLLAKRPQVLIIALYRVEEAFSRPIEDVERDVLGYKALQETEAYPAAHMLPILLIGHGVRESDIPTTINYDLFLSFPRDVKLYVAKVKELATKVKSRRKLSDYLCPCCRSRLIALDDGATRLFCPRCHTTVDLLDEDRIGYAPEGTYSSVLGSRSQLGEP